MAKPKNVYQWNPQQSKRFKEKNPMLSASAHLFRGSQTLVYASSCLAFSA